MLHPVEDQAQHAPGQDHGREGHQELPEVLLVAPKDQLILQSRVDGDLALAGVLRLQAKPLEDGERSLLLCLVVVDVRGSRFSI